MNQKRQAAHGGKPCAAQGKSIEGLDNNKSSMINVICRGLSKKGVKLESTQTGLREWFPISKVEIISGGAFNRGEMVTVAIPKWLLAQKKQAAKQGGAKQHKKTLHGQAPILVNGVCVGITNLAYKIKCDDGVVRNLAISQMIEVKSEIITGEPASVIVPAWVLLRADRKTYPDWVKGAMV